MATEILTHLMFEGAAEEAINLYVSLFPDSEITHIERYAAGEGPEGTVRIARFTLARQNLIAIDSPVKHGFTFTPAVSLFVECESRDELDRVFTTLSTGGKVLMPLDNYGFSSAFGWVADRFGVSWQLNLR